MIAPIRQLLFSVCLLLATTTVSCPAAADEATAAAQQLAQATISEGQAAAVAKSQHGGKVLSVSKSNNNGRIIYRVKLLLDSGRVIIVSVDGQTGRVSG